jgi:peptidoglycan biosynthesis protein MviN/MurJ (putative lipid II flippase)
MELIALVSFSLVVLIGTIAIIYYLLTMKKIAEQERRTYHDFAKRYIGGIAGGITVFIGTQMSVIWNNGDLIENRVVGIVILFTLMLFFVVTSLLLFVKMDKRMPPETH